MKTGPVLILIPLALMAVGCARPSVPVAPAPVIAVENFLADLTRQVTGTRLEVRSLVPFGVDPHGYEPTPQDIAAVARARLIVVNGAGLESFISTLISNAGGDRPLVEASDGLAGRGADPHFWLDPVMVVRYVQNIRDALSRIDPAGEKTYGANGDAYIRQLRELDSWIEAKVSAIPAEKRFLITDREGLGYFADRYGFRIVGTARGPQLALYIYSLTDSSGPAPTYLEMMRYDVTMIVDALAGDAR